MQHLPQYAVDTATFDNIDALRFRDEYFLQHRPILVRNCFCQSSPISEMGNWDTRSLFEHPEVASLPAEVSCQHPGDIMNGFEWRGATPDLTAVEALRLLRCSNHRATTNDVPQNDQRVYVKVSLTDVPSLTRRVTHFLNDEPLEAVAHPMLLRPGGYFCWAFVGDALSGSKTHVDVMGSDAWLVVLRGRKKWAICHPADKHLVMHPVTGAFANLFDVDTLQFPHASKARIAFFYQESGDAIFVPGDAPHAVLNESDSISITFNFMKKEGLQTWQRMMERVVDEDSAAGIVDLVMTEDSHDPRAGESAEVDSGSTRCLTMRLHVSGKCWNNEANGGAKFLSEYRCRVLLDHFHSALKVVQRPSLLSAEFPIQNVVGSPVGYYEQNAGDRRVLIHYSVHREDFAALWTHFVVPSTSSRNISGNPLSCSYDVMLDQARPVEVFSYYTLFECFASHIGRVPNFPPLSVLLRQGWYFESAWKVVSLFSIVSKRTKQRMWQDGALQQQKVTPDIHSLSMWHYSRFPWIGEIPVKKPQRSSQAEQHQEQPPSSSSVSPASVWSCVTYLFYSSPYLKGPLSLFPLTEDTTLQSHEMILQTRSHSKPTDVNHFDYTPTSSSSSIRFQPHFEEFIWNQSELLEPCGEEDTILGLVDLGDDLQREILTKLLLVDGSSEFLRFCGKHRSLSGVEGCDWSACGIEKLMLLALYFGVRPAVIGFTYSFVFRHVSEPSTVCLVGSAAQDLLRRTIVSSPANLATEICNQLEALVPFDSVGIAKHIQEEASSSSEFVPACAVEWCSSLVREKQREYQYMLGLASPSSSEAEALNEQLRRCQKISEELERFLNELTVVDKRDRVN